MRNWSTIIGNTMSESKDNNQAAFPLAMAEEGDHVEIYLVRSGKSLQARLTSLGLNIGSELIISQRKGGDLVVIRGETRLALGFGLAQKIIVIKV